MLTAQNKILILGGDSRQKYLFRLLIENGNEVEHICSDFNKEQISEANIIILPIPVTKDNELIFCTDGEFNLTIDDFLGYISPSASVFGGMFSLDFEEKLKEKNITYYDFGKDESFTRFNAHLTAQGVLRLLLENAERYLPSKKVLITGYGRISKALVSFLKGLSMDVYIAARSVSQRNEAELFGLKAIDICDIERSVYVFDYIINTVPFQIFSSDAVRNIKQGAVYFEVASRPFGAGEKDFEETGKKYILASQLPGRFYPEQSAGAILKSLVTTDQFMVLESAVTLKDLL